MLKIYRPCRLIFVWVSCFSLINLKGAAQDFAMGTYDYAATSSRSDLSLPLIRQLYFQRLDTVRARNMSFPDSINSVWIRFSVTNVSTATTQLAVDAGFQAALMYLYKDSGGEMLLLGRTGMDLPYSQQSAKGEEKRIFFSLPPNSVQMLYLCFARYHEKMGISVPLLETRSAAQAYFYVERKPYGEAQSAQFFFAGFFLALCLYSLLKFSVSPKDKVYLVYALLNISATLAISVYFNFPSLENSLFPWIKNDREICTMISSLTIVFHILFFQYLLEMKKNAPLFYRVTSLYIAFHLIATILFPALAAPPERWFLSRIAFYFFATSEFLYLLICISFLIYLWPVRKGMYSALFYVSCFMTIGMTVFAVSSIVFRQGTFISKEGDWLGYFLLALFVLGEAWFSVKALTYREKSIELENTKFQEELIAQLSENKRVQENFRKDLEVQVKERSGKILEQQKLLEQEREAKMLAVMNRRILETEMQALRSQMNPHFIFNSLNSIENFMMKNDKRMASDYFAKFALLIRMILDNSQTDLVPFVRDMEALQLYVELEQLRFDQRFSYQTIVDPVLKNDDFNVPPLLIQPFVENAIIHGLAQSDKPELLLTVSAELDMDYIIYTIRDNGIGRTKSREYNHYKTRHQSLGMGITQQRIAILNQQEPNKGEVTIDDLYDSFGEPAGTRVEVKFKAV